jgi:ATP-dependent DNA helicase RecG
MAAEPKDSQSKSNRLEDCSFDYKEKIDESFGKILCAYANTDGGSIVLGISKHGKAAGVSQKDEESATNIAENCKPPVKFISKWEEKDGKNLLTIDVPKSDKIHTWKGIAYKRAGSSSFPMSVEEIIELSRKRGDIKFDEEICEGATTIKDIDWDFVRSFYVPLYEQISGRNVVGSAKDFIRSLGCLKKGRPTNGAVLLFGKNPQAFFGNAYIALARYKGKEVGGEHIDYKEFTGNLFRQITNCNDYIVEHIAIMSRLHPGKVQGENIPEYGLFSIRELITNAVCHRDYFAKGSKVIIKMFDDRIEVYNRGGLPEGITPKNIASEQHSRNPVIARALAKVKFIEEIGEGWDKIIEEHRTHPLKPAMPLIKADKEGVLVTVFSTREKFEEAKILELSERQRKIVEYLKEHGRITRSICMKILDVSKDTAVRELSYLKSKGAVGQRGVGRGICYVLK